MRDGITATLVGTESVMLKLDKLYPSAQDQLVRSITRTTTELVGYIKQSKLSGQVLHRRTGKLSRSVHVVPPVVNGDSIVGRAAANVTYAAYLEYGFSGTISVQESLRNITQAFGKPLSGGSREVTVRAHSRTVNFPAHSFMRSALADKREKIEAAMRTALSKLAQ